MLIVLSPAKSLDLSPAKLKLHTQAEFLNQSSQLIDVLRPLSPPQLSQLMDISDDLAQLNANRYASWQAEMDLHSAKQAILMFDGDVYDGLQARAMTTPDLKFAQEHLRILSGLYGLLRPLDLMLAYRLEMGTRLANPRGRDLYAFWGEQITQALNQQLQASQSKYLINLASEEYFKAVKPALLTAPVITPVFEDWKNGKYKIISFFAKRARGSMARYVIAHRVKTLSKLRGFAEDGYAFAPEVSSGTKWVFRRRLEE
ncbi:MAG: peroxide stress protein YaaA [Burkholderiales bacterium]|nr:peroxide stress protein YaaA [Burkholderiales bacterium]